jgi:hypothetical protein
MYLGASRPGFGSHSRWACKRRPSVGSRGYSIGSSKESPGNGHRRGLMRPSPAPSLDVSTSWPRLQASKPKDQNTNKSQEPNSKITRKDAPCLVIGAFEFVICLYFGVCCLRFRARSSLLLSNHHPPRLPASLLVRVVILIHPRRGDGDLNRHLGTQRVV